MRRKMGESLVRAGLITEDALRTALAEQKRTGERLGLVLTRLELATETGIAQALASQLGLPYRDLGDQPPDPAVAGSVPREIGLKHAAVAVSLDQRVLTVAMADPLLLGLVQDLERRTGYSIRQVVATRGGILGAIAAAQITTHASADTTELATPVSQTPGPREILQDILSNAVARGATDVHIEPTAQKVVVRERVDGMLQDAMHVPTRTHDALVAAVKGLAGMQASETRLPQDGRIRHAVEGGPPVDFRVTSLRTLFGEKVVLRRWDRPGAAVSLDDLGLSTTTLARVREFVTHTHGLVLAVGPAGSGVQATLAALAADLSSPGAGGRDIVSLEDPIEHQIPGVTQTSVDRANGETLGARLQVIVEQRPDVLVVGELRDAETARVAFSAAADTLVLTTLRSDDLPSAIEGLVAMDVDAGVIAASLVGAVTQRLVRRLCVSCRRPSTAPGLPGPATFFTAVGCEQCHHTGYRGRIGVYEATAVSAAVREAIAGPIPRQRVADALRQGGGVSLWEDALSKATSGATTVDELGRVIGAGQADEIERARPLCAACGAPVGAGFLACPACGTTIGSTCVHCGRALQQGWRFCPYCARRVEHQRRGREGNRDRARTVLS